MFKKKNKLKLLRKTTSVKEDIIALEMSKDRVFVAQLSGSVNNWKLDRFDYTYFETEINFDDENSRKFASRVITGLLKRSNIKTKSVALCVPVSNAIIRTVQSPLMNDEELKQALKTNTLWENLLEIDNIKFEEYSVYHQVISRNTEANTMELLFVASKISEIEKIIQVAIEASLKPVVIDVKCFTYKNALDINQAPNNESEEISAVINIGSDENYLMIMQGNNQRITEIFATPEELSEFRANENSPSVSFSFIDRYCLQVEQVISEFNAQNKKMGKKSVSVIEVVSPINALPAIIANLSKHLPTCEIRVLNILDLIIIPEQHKTKLESLNNPSIAASVIGLATRKLDVYGYYKFIEAVKNVNLLPNREQLITETIRQKRFKLSFLLCFVFFIVSSSLYFKIHYDIHKDFSQINEKNSKILQTFEYKSKGLSELRKKQKDITYARETMEKVNSNQKQSYAILSTIQKSINSNLVIDEIHYSDLESVYIIGRAKTDNAIVQFMDKLRVDKNIVQVSIENMNNDDDSNIKNFTIRCITRIGE